MMVGGTVTVLLLDDLKVVVEKRWKKGWHRGSIDPPAAKNMVNR